MFEWHKRPKEEREGVKNYGRSGRLQIHLTWKNVKKDVITEFRQENSKEVLAPAHDALIILYFCLKNKSLCWTIHFIRQIRHFMTFGFYLK